ncbi:M20/M25/M40 family metallo-hydrolase [Evansella cellulosilytica]|uniref:Peptidase M20 n=1 Tax=Evansella cellulosilytica (strain ATCC 21833 / DSM 2522 / FERM P-1141 / JCM 9156 / N-4) TaxID=649639 RepID=E6TSN5_EVAC2|nr:M20/M25/M40 family metallo-hydrolase [Evansella cellulosilytica]ADU29543.1 peptidase M20 [Evansella cellulosilytica DSM 2522]
MEKHKQMIHEKPEVILQNLIRFNTTNPPGHEKACIDYIESILNEYGIESTIISLDPKRPNLIARLKGEGNAPPLMMYGHVDVVTTENQNWTHPPFSGEIIDGYVWGRGALDMKSGVAMMIAAFLRAKKEETKLPGDILLVVLSDEENGGNYGAKFLVEEHPELFEGVKYAFGEFGGFSMELDKKRFYPIMVAEKQSSWVKLTIKGQGGHGSMPVRDGAMAKLSRLLDRLNKPLPVHINPVVRDMVKAIAKEMSLPKKIALKQLLNPKKTERILKLLGPKGSLFESLLHHTVSPTIIRASDKINVIPGEITVEVDGRILPGFTEEDFEKELTALINDPSIKIEFIRSDIVKTEPDMTWFNTLGTILKESDKKAKPIPYVLPGVTDSRFFSSLGIQTYGFTPMNLPADFNFTQSVHAEDERIPVECVSFGANALFKAIQRIGN